LDMTQAFHIGLGYARGFPATVSHPGVIVYRTYTRCILEGPRA